MWAVTITSVFPFKRGSYPKVSRGLWAAWSCLDQCLLSETIAVSQTCWIEETSRFTERKFFWCLISRHWDSQVEFEHRLSTLMVSAPQRLKYSGLYWGVGFVFKWAWKGATVLPKQISRPKVCSQGSTLCLGQLLVLHCSCQFMVICAYFIASGSSLGFSFVVYMKEQVPFMPERKHTDFLYVPSK